ncbi:MAG: amidohydrolase [Steroidobacteraceae bacterium]|nr:amidohydrolase [Steroidobacteraceae bacterium]
MTEIKKDPGYRRIATEEAWAPPELITEFRRVLEKKLINDPAFESLWGYYGGHPSERAQNLLRRIQRIDESRIADMDATGIDMQLLLLTAPGVQVLERDTAVSMAKFSNDVVAEAVRKHPTRLAALAAVAPQAPAEAAKELERAVKTLGLKGAVINSHTRGEFLDDPKFWDIFAAAEALDVPVYIHPSGPPPQMAQPFLERGLEGAIFGFGVEVALHVLRIIVSGAFDRFPKLKIVIGHTGEGLPFWLYRIDYMHAASVRSQRYAHMKPLRKKPSDYIRENLYITNSGVAWEPSIMFCHKVLGPDHVLYAMDYPYQFEPQEVAIADALPMSDIDKKKFFQLNAEKLFKL